MHENFKVLVITNLDTGTGKQRQLINVSELATSLGKECCSALLGLYVFTGEDCTSAVNGKGEVLPLKKLHKNPRYLQSFQQLGSDWKVSPDLYLQLEEFTLLIYGYHSESKLNTIRAIMLKKMVGEDDELTRKLKVKFSRLPPCANSLLPHVDRVNHMVAIFKRSHVPLYEATKPYDGQGWVKEGDLFEPTWSYGLIFPPSVIDIFEANENEDDDDNDSVTDYEDVMEYLDNNDDE